jgi:hypothetical protein
MNARHGSSPRRLCRVGLYVLLTMHTAGSLANKSLSNDPVDDSSPTSFGESGPTSADCAAAVRRSLEIAPELLALASWPLDDTLPAECVAGDSPPAIMAEGQTPPEVNVEDVTPADDSYMADETTAVRIKTEQGAASAQDTIEASARAAPNPLGNQLAALGSESLDDIRGGFELADSNLKFSFGIERAVFINGALVSTTVLNLRDLQWTAGVGNAPQVLTDGMAGAVGVIQNGPGNSVPAQIGANLAGTVIQNTLNNQNLRTVTTINAAVNSAQVLRAMSVQSAVQNGLVNSLRR